MPPPTSFITISSVPFSQLVTQAMFNVANVQWFKYTATTPIAFGMQCNIGGTFNPKIILYQSDGTTQVGLQNVGNTGFWIWIKTAGDYYIKVVRQPLGASNFDFTFTADTKPINTISLAIGDIIINDDSLNYPATVLNSTGIIKTFASSIPAGEMGAILRSNISFWHDRFGQYSTVNQIAIFDTNLTHITSVSCGLTGGAFPPFATDITNNKVYVINQDGQLWTISSTGITTNTGYVFPPDPAPHPDIVAVNEDGTKLYWGNVFNNLGVIHVLNLTTLTPLPDFYTIPTFTSSDFLAKNPNGNTGDMFVMPDGNVVTWWYSNTSDIYHLIVISKTGVLLNTYDYVGSAHMNLNHLAYINGDSDHIIGWWYIDDFFSVGQIGRLTLSTGVIDQIFTSQMFSEGINSNGTDKFGASNSCTLLRFQDSTYTGGGTTPPPTPDLGGIYFVSPTITHDKYYDRGTPPGPTGSVDKKIPNPTVRSAVMGQ
jgi:hypothetical protein